MEAPINEHTEGQSMRSNIAMIGGIPYLVLELVAECIGQEMDGMEALMDIPRRIYHQDAVQEMLERSDRTWVCRSGARCALRALTGVHGEVAKLAWRILRRRLFFKNPTSQKLAERPSWLKGTSVRELWVRWEADDLSYKPDFGSILDWIASQLPNLRVLSLEQDHILPRRLMATFVKLAPSLPIHALHIYITHWDESALLCLYDSISQMPNLSTLSICGTLYSNEDSFTYEKSLHLASMSPPPSLKSLMLTLRWEGKGSRAVDLLTWILQPRDHYILEDLMFRYYSEDWMFATLTSHVRVFASLLSATLPHLRVFDIDFFRNSRQALELVGQFVKTCGILEELQVVSIPVYPLPKTLQVLRIDMSINLCHGLAGYDDEELAEYLHGVLSSGEVPDLRRVYVTAYECRTRRTYPRSLEICESFGVALLSMEQGLPPI